MRASTDSGSLCHHLRGHAGPRNTLALIRVGATGPVSRCEVDLAVATRYGIDGWASHVLALREEGNIVWNLLKVWPKRSGCEASFARIRVCPANARRLPGWLLVVLLVACGGPQVKDSSDYRAGTIRDKRVVLLPLAVSDDWGDERTGVVLSRGTREIASERACKNVARDWQDGSVVCLSAPGEEEVAVLRKFEVSFAKDEPIPESVWRQIHEVTGADHALLFRPESISSSRDVDRTVEGRFVHVPGGSPSSLLLSALIYSETVHVETTQETEVSYTVSALLVDLRGGKVLRVGLHSASDSRTVDRNLGYAEAPPAAPILEEVMTELSEELLDE